MDLVTAADRASEKLIVERLQARWPEHGIVGRRRHPQRHRRGLPLVCRSAGRNHEFRARLPGVLRFDCAGPPGRPAGSRRALRSHARRVVRRRTRTRRDLERQTASRLEDRHAWRVDSWERAFPATSGTRTRTSTSISRSPCARTECVGRAQPRSTWPMSPPDATTDSGSST